MLDVVHDDFLVCEHLVSQFFVMALNFGIFSNYQMPIFDLSYS